MRTPLVRLGRFAAVALVASPLIMAALPHSRWLLRLQLHAASFHINNPNRFVFCGNCDLGSDFPEDRIPNNGPALQKLVSLSEHAKPNFQPFLLLAKEHMDDPLFVAAAAREGLLSLTDSSYDSAHPPSPWITQTPEAQSIASPLISIARAGSELGPRDALYPAAEAIAFHVLNMPVQRNAALARLQGCTVIDAESEHLARLRGDMHVRMFGYRGWYFDFGNRSTPQCRIGRALLLLSKDLWMGRGLDLNARADMAKFAMAGLEHRNSVETIFNSARIFRAAVGEEDAIHYILREKRKSLAEATRSFVAQLNVGSEPWIKASAAAEALRNHRPKLESPYDETFMWTSYGYGGLLAILAVIGLVSIWWLLGRAILPTWPPAASPAVFAACAAFALAFTDSKNETYLSCLIGGFFYLIIAAFASYPKTSEMANVLGVGGSIAAVVALLPEFDNGGPMLGWAMLGYGVLLARCLCCRKPGERKFPLAPLLVGLVTLFGVLGTISFEMFGALDLARSDALLLMVPVLLSLMFVAGWQMTDPRHAARQLTKLWPALFAAAGIYYVYGSLEAIISDAQFSKMDAYDRQLLIELRKVLDGATDIRLAQNAE